MKIKSITFLLIALILAACSSPPPAEPAAQEPEAQASSAPAQGEPTTAAQPTATAEPTAIPWQVITPENAASLVEIANLSGHGCSVFSLTFSPNSQMLASTSCDQTLRLWDLGTGQSRIIGQAGVEFGTQFSTDGAILAAWSNDNTIIIYDVISGDTLHTIEDGANIYAAALSPDGSTLAAASAEGVIKFWELASGTELPSLSADLGERYGSALYVRQVDFSPDGALLVSTDEDEKVRLWDLAIGSVVRTIDIPDATSAVFSSDGSLLVVTTVRSYNNSSDSEYIVKLYDVASGSRLANLSGDPDKGSDTALSPDGLILVVSVGTYKCCDPATDGAILIFDVANGTELLRLTGHTDLVSAVALSPDGRFIASGGADGDRTIRLWGIYP